MNSNLSDESVIREYLLGTLPEQDWDEIEQKMLSDKEFADFVDSIEDEIIEEYLTVQNHFLRPPARQQKLLFAKVLRSNLRKGQEAPVEVPRSLHVARTSRPYWGAIMGAAAVLVFLTAPLTVYTAMLRSNLTIAKAKNNNTEFALAQANQVATNLEKELALLGNQDTVNLFSTSRDAGKVHIFTTRATSREIHISLKEPISRRYRVDLPAIEGNAPWFQNDVLPTDSGVLVFRMPYYGPGTYKLTVAGSDGKNAEEYSFKAIEQIPGTSSAH
ncbi:MAG TPA: hypothetical protein VG759_28235 [Candidatus Angelobacter sp.]|jgi:hypothetical protein|nr:hypothetical protein [Candidatus Angelobacter sp.]